MFNVLFTIDYEIHGNGDGSPYDLMIEPTDRLLKIFDRYGAKLTIMADVAEIIKFKEYFEKTGQDKFFYKLIIEQLSAAIAKGHDVQLHIHSGYFNARHNGTKWIQNWDEYNLAKLSKTTISDRIRLCKEFLISELKTESNNYNIIAFRAANWSMVPTKNILEALSENGIKIDTSVFKYGKRNNRVKFDYSNAYDKLFPWIIDKNDINKTDRNGDVLEIPIYCELRSLIHFITPIRLYRIFIKRFHKHKKSETEHSDSTISENVNVNHNKFLFPRVFNKITKHYPWKLDFNQATGKQLISALKRIENEYKRYNLDLPIVFIGHSKSFIKLNEKQINILLKFITNKRSKYKYSLFKDINLNIFEVFERFS